MKKALNRIAWRFGGNGNKKPFPVNTEDINAFNEIAEYYEQTQKQQFEANQLFAKLYIFLSMRVMEKEGTTVFDNSARRRISNILEKPLSQIVQEYQKSLNDSDLYAFKKDLGLTMKHPALHSELDKVNDLKILQANKVEFTEKCTTEVWDYETVNTALIAEVNQQINLNR